MSHRLGRLCVKHFGHVGHCPRRDLPGSHDVTDMDRNKQQYQLESHSGKATLTSKAMVERGRTVRKSNRPSGLP